MSTQKQSFFFTKILVITIMQMYYTSLHSYSTVSFPPTTAYGATVQKTLLSAGDDDTIFICYVGHKDIKTYIRKNYMTCKLICSEPTNTFTQLDLNAAIEWSFNPIKEINNRAPVNAIARHNDLYLIAQENNVYVCNKKIGALKDF